MRAEAVKLLLKAIDINEHPMYHCNIDFSLHIGAFYVSVYEKSGTQSAVYHSGTCFFNSKSSAFTTITQVHATLDAILAGTYTPVERKVE